MDNYEITYRKEKGMFDITYTLPFYKIQQNEDDKVEEISIQAFSLTELHDSIVYENPNLYFLQSDILKIAKKYHIMVLDVDCKERIDNDYINYIISRIDNVVSVHGSCKIVVNHLHFITVTASTSFVVTNDVIEIRGDSILILKTDSINSIDILY